MSAIASVRLIEKEKIPKLREMAGMEPMTKKALSGSDKEVTDPFWDWFRENTTEIATLGWSGFIYNTLIIYLKKKRDVDLFNLEMSEVSNFLTKKRPYLMILFTAGDAAKLAGKLSPSSFSALDIKKYYEEFDEEKSPYPPESFIDAIQMLYEALLNVSDNQVLIFNMA